MHKSLRDHLGILSNGAMHLLGAGASNTVSSPIDSAEPLEQAPCHGPEERNCVR
ncbi:MAG: hypothetical protein OJF51_002006 [Nitrospira sp.]|nr:MAG: hypothetical protein OJF51_002006 [Nitrospira sp.]